MTKKKPEASEPESIPDSLPAGLGQLLGDLEDDAFALEDDDLEDEEPDVSQASPMARTLGRAIAALVKAGEVELCEGVDPVLVAMRVLDNMRKDTLKAMFYALVDDKGVEEVYCDERAVGEALRAADS